MDRDALIALVRKETGMKLSVEDPILAVAVMHEKLLDAVLERVEAAAQQASAEMASAVAGVSDDVTAAGAKAVSAAQTAAGRTVTEASEWAAEQLRAVGAEVAATLLHETQAEVARAETAGRAARRYAWVAGCLCAATFAVAGGTLLAVLRLG